MKRSVFGLVFSCWVIFGATKQLCGQESSWTVQKLAEQVRLTMERFDTVSLQTTYEQTRDVNAFRQQAPLIVKGAGSVVYRGDGDRWFYQDDGFSFRSGVAEVYPQTRISGYDGAIHYQGDPKRVVLGESASRRKGRPKSLIWETMLTYDYIAQSFARDTTVIVDKSIATANKLPSVEMKSSWSVGDTHWELHICFETERSFLPRWQRLTKDGKLYAESSTSDYVMVEGSNDWYPSIVDLKFHQRALGVVDQQVAISQFDLPEAFGEDAFAPSPPIGADVVDRRTNLAWHSDPWWNEMVQWTSANLGWPRFKYRAIDEFQSQCDETAEGMDAPKLTGSWGWGDDPGSWDREDRKFSILYFWGDASYVGEPHPRWTAELAALDSLVKPYGGEVIGIASHRTDADALKSTANELKFRIPFLIDQQSDGEGVTHDAFRLKHYYSVLVVDHESKVRLVTQKRKLLDTIATVLDPQEMDAVRAIINIDASMSRVEHDAIKQHWLKLRRQTQARGSIQGTIETDINVTVRLVPEMRMLHGNNPGGYMLFRDNQGVLSVDVDPDVGHFKFDNLPRGVYELQIKSLDGNEQKSSVTLVENDGTRTMTLIHTDSP